MPLDSHNFICKQINCAKRHIKKNSVKNSLKLKYNYIKLYKPQSKDTKPKLVNTLYLNLPKINIMISLYHISFSK